jgi:hypothetical protein
MKRAWGMGVVVGMAVALAVSAQGAAPQSAAQKLRVKSLTLGVGHRVFTEFYDEATVRLNEEFRVGDTEYTAKVTEFVPDFTMDMATRRIVSRSNAPNNPALHVLVRRNGAPDDTTWAFLNMPPHYGRHSMLAFRILKLEFENHDPIVARRDTTKAAAPARKS